MIEPTDNELIERIKLDDTSAFELIVKRYQQKVFRTCIGFVHNKDDAEDLTQEVFITVFKKINSFKGNSSFSTWLYRVAMNKSLNHLRKIKLKHLFTSVDDVENNLVANEKTDDNILKSEEQNKIHEALSKLTISQRKAFVLSHYQELSNQELAEVMNVSLKAAESLLYRGRMQLRKFLTS